MDFLVLPAILLVISTVHAFQYTELVRYIDSHQEEYVEVQNLLFPLVTFLRVQALEMLCFFVNIFKRDLRLT